MASTIVEVVDEVDMRLLLASRGDCPAVSLLSIGQPIDCAKFSMEGVTGLLLPTSMRSRRADVRRVRVLEVGEAVSTTTTAGRAVLRGE